MPHKVEAFLRRKQLERDRHALDDLVEAARARGAQEGFQLRERQFDRVEVRTVRRQEPKPGPDALNRRLDLGLLVHREVVEHDDVARPQCRDEHLLHVGEKAGIVDRPVEHGRGRQALDAQRGDDGVRLPMPAGRVIAEALPARAPAVPAEQVGGDPRFVDEDVAASIVQRLGVLPAAAPRGDIRASLFVRVYRFF